MPSELYNENIYSPVRRTTAEVKYSLVAPEAKEIAEIVLPSGNLFSRPEQVANNISDVSARVATFEPSYWRLDGSFVLPLPPEQSNMEVGFWGREMSDGSGTFESPPVIEITFPIVQNVKRFGVSFDEPTNNFCVDFQITVYDSYDNIILNERITDNNNSYGATHDGALNARRVVYKFYKTNNPFRHLRISELDFGIIIKFGGNDILSLGLTTEANPTGAAFPLPGLNFSVKNNERFDPLDAESYAQYLYARQAFEYRHGLVLPDGSTEWSYMGAYYLQSWNISDDSVSFTCGGKSSLIENYTYSSSTLQQFTIGALIRRVLTDVGLQYHIDPVLDNSPVITGWFGDKNYREVLANLIELSCCLGYENQHNAIEFTDILGEPNPIVNMNYANMFTRPTIKLEPYYNGINLKEYALREGEQDVQIDGAEIFYPAPWRDPNEPDYPYRVDLPCMVVTPEFPAFREWFLARKFALLSKRLSGEINWRQNMELQIGDGANVQLNKKGSRANMTVVKQIFNFNGGAFSGNTKVVGDGIL